MWSDVEGFLRNPGKVLEQLRAKLEGDAKGADKLRDKQRRLEGLLAAKAVERNRVVGLYRRGRLTDADLDQQMGEIGQEQVSLEAQLAELKSRADSASSMGANLGSAEALLAKLRKRLDGPISWESKRQLIEVLVGAITVETVEEHGVIQPRVTIRYRFEQPNELERRVLPPEYLRSPIRIPVKPQTVGDHIRLRRLNLKLLQKDVARKLGVATPSIHNWEANASEPGLQYFPAIIEFLGYNPLPPPKNWAERLVTGRTSRGLTQKAFAQALEVDPSTLARWERGEREPMGSFAVRAERLLAATARTPVRSLRVG